MIQAVEEYHTKRQPRTSRLRPSIGQSLCKFLLEKFTELPEKKNIATNDSKKWLMFSEIISRIANDVAGNRYALADDGSQFSAFDRIFNKLTENISEELNGKEAAQKAALKESFKSVLDSLPSFTKGIVQTPHPTEVLSSEAIEAEDKLHRLLENNHVNLFDKIGKGQSPAEADYNDVIRAMGELWNKLKPLTVSLNVTNEMARSVKFSEVMFDSVPLVMQSILESAERSGMYSGYRLNFEELTKFNFMLQPETWSPGDRDSKELMTAEMLQSGINLNERSMRLHYARKLAEIYLDLDKEQAKMLAPSGDETVGGIIHNMIYRMISGIPDDYINDYLKYHCKDCPKIQEILRNIHNKINEDKQKKGGMINDPSHPESIEVAYENEREFLQDLAYLREIPDVKFESYPLPNNGADGKIRNSYIDKLDALYVQANNFGLRALRSQIRENAEMHAQIMEIVLQTLYNANIAISGYNPIQPATAKEPEVIKELLDVLMSKKDGGAIGNAIHDKLIDKMKVIESDIAAAKANNNLEKFKEKRSEDYKFYETMKGFEIAANNPQAIPRYLIAECKDSSDTLAAFFMLKAMESNEARHDLTKKKVEIVPLFEHRTDVENAPQTILEAYNNEHFRNHHNALTDHNDPAITKPQKLPCSVINNIDPLGIHSTVLLENKDAPHITIAEAKKRYGIQVNEGDDDKPVKATKIVMYAGSDITKSAGAGGAGLVMHTTNIMREKLLNEQNVLLVDYTGVGGGAHRSQPVATAFETAQGRSLRQTPQSIMQKILMQSGRAVRKTLGLELSPIHFINDEDNKKQTVLTAQLNMGNIAALAWNNKNWEETQKRLESSMTKYQRLYNADDYSAYLGFTADNFVKLTSYAARSAVRARSTGDKGKFPPLVDVNNLRAIGYGAALNVSGSCAGLYYGVSEFINVDENGKILLADLATLKDLYLTDPIAQDRINRATYGVVMADMDTAWKYLGYERIVIDDKVVLRKDGQDFSCDEFIQSRTDKKEECKDLSTVDNKLIVASSVLAKIDKEYQSVSKGLLQLHRAVKCDAGLGVNISDKPAAKQLLDELPEALKTQISDSLRHAEPVRNFLADKFNNIVSGKQQPLQRPKDDSAEDVKKEFDDIYYAMGAMFEIFENIPRAYTRLRWALNIEMAKDKIQTVAC